MLLDLFNVLDANRICNDSDIKVNFKGDSVSKMTISYRKDTIELFLYIY